MVGEDILQNRRSRRRRASGGRASESGRSSATLAQRELIQNTFGIPSELTSLMSRQNMDEILLAEAMRRSMSMDQQVPREEEGGKGSTMESNENKSLLDLARGDNEDDMLAAAIALSLKEQNNREGDSSKNHSSDDKGSASLDSQSLKGDLKKQSPPAGSASLDPVSNNKQVRLDSKVGTTAEATVRSDTVEEEALHRAIEQSKLSQGTSIDSKTCSDRKLEAYVSTEENSGGSEDDADISPGSKVDPEIAAKHNHQTSKLKVELSRKNDVVAEVQMHLSEIIETVVSSESDAKLPATPEV